MSEGDGKQSEAAVADRKVAWDWHIFFRLLYLIGFLTVTLPVIFFALAAYQYQVDAMAIAEEKALDASELMWRAAYINRSMHALATDGQADPAAMVPATDATDGGADRQATEVTSAQDQDPGLEAGTAAKKSPAGQPAGQADRQTADAPSAAVTCAQAVGTRCLGARLPADERADAVALAAELQRFDRLSLGSWLPFYGRPSALAELPHWSLTLVVTLVAGLLGSLIFVLKTTLRQRLDVWSARATLPRESRPWSWFLLRPVFGVVVALGAYVALQSGVLVFDGAMSLEPSAYVTAAVGLIAGLLSWHVIETIERIGQQWLESNRPQWGYGLRRYIDVRGAKISELAKNIDVSEKLLEHWMAQRLQVPKEYTKRLAGELNVHPEVLFSSVPPWRRSNTASGT